MIDPKTTQAPHDCPGCGEPAYLGFGVPARCSNRECPFFCQELWADHVMALPDEDREPGQYLDIENEDTQPWIELPTLADLYAGKGVWRSHARNYKVAHFKKPLDDD